MLIPVAFILGLLAGYLAWGQPQSPAVAGANTPVPQAQAAVSTRDAQPAAQNNPDPQAAADNSEPTQEIIRYDVPIDDDPILGSPDAPITIIEFSDYECPYCRRWHLEVFPLIRQNYPDQVRFVFRDFPLTSIHPNAVPAAVAANCAHEQGKFWEFNEALFSMQLGLNKEAYLGYAQSFGLDIPAFETCLTDKRHEQEVLDDLNWASSLGVRSTPTFFLNGIALVGAQPYELFQTVIEKELAGEIPK
jgi:protein-disulfide isomerase